MTVVLKLLQDKGREVHTIGPDESVYDAIAAMARENVGSLVVTSDGRVVGIITERNYARDVILRGRTSAATPVRDVMTTRVIYVRPETTVDTCMAIMTQQRIRHLPVMDNGNLVGIISIGDVVKSIISEQKFIIDELIHFVVGER